MKVMVIGSYRSHEGQRTAARDAEERFKATAAALGKGLAEQGHDLVLGWSYNNVASQLGVKTQDGVLVTQHAKSHPYWETADFHALRGFLSVLRQYPTNRRRKRVFVDCVGKNDDVPGTLPFPSPAVLDRLATAPLARYRTDPGDSRVSIFNPAEKVDLGDDAHAAFIDIRRVGDVNSTAMRQELLLHLITLVDAVIVIGGGKATFAIIAQCDPAKLLLPATFMDEGAFSVEETAERHRQSPKLQSMWAEIAARSGGESALMAHNVPRHLTTLLAAARRPGIALPYRTHAFQLSVLMVLGMLSGLCAAVWASAASKGASIPITLCLEAFAVIFFGLLLWAEFQLLFKDKHDPLQVFLGVVAAGVLSIVPTLGLMTDGLGLIPPRSGTANAPIDPRDQAGNAAN